MIKRISLLLLFTLCCAVTLDAQAAHRALRNGNKAYKDKLAYFRNRCNTLVKELY